MTSIFGFTLLRNGVKYDYSFRECLTSMSNVCTDVYLALGKGEDKTEDQLKDLGFLKIIPTVWDESLREGGLILSQQTNVALKELEKDKAGLNNAWGIYLQCDEVFLEEDYELIIEDIKKADELGHDVIRFRYLHFWQDHHSLAINKKWYPQEIRAIKLNQGIESWGDAQSFKNFKNPYDSDARIFHYGHVREQDSYKNKKADILKLYHSDEKMSKYKKREKRFDDQTECLHYLGPHPLIMKNRIERLGDFFYPEIVDKVYIIGNKSDYSDEFINSILAKEVYFESSFGLIPKEYKKKVIKVSENFMDKLLQKSSVPNQMRSKLARQWNQEFLLTLKLSEKGIGVKSKV